MSRLFDILSAKNSIFLDEKKFPTYEEAYCCLISNYHEFRVDIRDENHNLYKEGKEMFSGPIYTKHSIRNLKFPLFRASLEIIRDTLIKAAEKNSFEIIRDNRIAVSRYIKMTFDNHYEAFKFLYFDPTNECSKGNACIDSWGENNIIFKQLIDLMVLACFELEFKDIVFMNSFISLPTLETKGRSAYVLELRLKEEVNG